MDPPVRISRFVAVWEKWQGMAFREVLVTQVVEVLRTWLAGQGQRPAAQRAGVDVKTAARYIRAAQEAGLAPDGGGGELGDEPVRLVAAARRALVYRACVGCFAWGCRACRRGRGGVRGGGGGGWVFSGGFLGVEIPKIVARHIFGIMLPA